MCACNQNRVTIPLWTEQSTFIHMIAPKGNSPIRKQRDHRPILILTKQSRGRTQPATTSFITRFNSLGSFSSKSFHNEFPEKRADTKAHVSNSALTFYSNFC